MSSVIHVNDQNFEEEVLKSSTPVLVDFAAEWCGPCKRLAPVIEELAQDFQGKAKVAHVDVDESKDSASQFNIMSVPTILFFKDGQQVDQLVGLVPKQSLAEKINSLL